MGASAKALELHAPQELASNSDDFQRQNTMAHTASVWDEGQGKLKYLALPAVLQAKAEVVGQGAAEQAEQGTPINSRAPPDGPGRKLGGLSGCAEQLRPNQPGWDSAQQQAVWQEGKASFCLLIPAGFHSRQLCVVPNSMPLPLKAVSLSCDQQEGKDSRVLLLLFSKHALFFGSCIENGFREEFSHPA